MVSNLKGVWIGNRPESENQVIALLSFPDDREHSHLMKAWQRW